MSAIQQIVETYGDAAAGFPTTWSATRKGTSVTLSNGNMDAETAGPWRTVLGTTLRSSGKYQFEVVCITTAGNHMGGVAGSGLFASGGLDIYLGLAGDSAGYAVNTMYHNGLGGYTPAGSFIAWGAGDVLTVAVDFTAQTIRYYVNGAASLMDTYAASISVCPAASMENGGKQRLRVAGLAYPVTGYANWG